MSEERDKELPRNMVDAAPKGFRPTGLMVVVAAIVAALLLFVPLPWVSWGSEVDIKSGRVRETTWIVGIPIRQKVEETWVSHHAAPLGEPDWHYAVTQDWWNHVSPHYHYHGAVNHVKTIALMMDEFPWDDDAQEAAAQELLRHWQTGSYWSADEYIGQLEAMLLIKRKGPKENRRVMLVDIPSPTPE